MLIMQIRITFDLLTFCVQGFFAVSIGNENDTCSETLAVVADSAAIGDRALLTVNITVPE